MEWCIDKAVNLFTGEKSKLLLDGMFGLEREAQRVTPEGELALTPHPSAFGNKLQNALVTTDFSESQLELITPPFDTIEKTYRFIEKLHSEVDKELGSEYLWPLSMPPKLPDEGQIPISKFDDSLEGREKELYRIGLSTRYGSKMQMISGIHYNFSFADTLIDYLYQQYGMAKDKRTFTDEIYFSMARNFLRYRWLIVYLFGASPCIDQTYYSVIDHERRLVKKCCQESCIPLKDYEQNAISIRVSRFGYSDTVQGKYNVSFNSLKEYIGGIRKLLSTKSSKFARLGIYKDGKRIQLNSNILQKESEYYSSIRLKRKAFTGETQLDALENRGVEYAEIRIIDINPFEKTGISLQQLKFLQVFMLFCLFEGNNQIGIKELEEMNKNHHLVALSGRKHGLKLYKYGYGRVLFKDWSSEIFNNLKRIAALMDTANKGNGYVESVEEEYKKIIDPDNLPSSNIIKNMRKNNESYLHFGMHKAFEHRMSEKSASLQSNAK